MSRLDDLIKEKCPNGVKYYSISDICNTLRSMSGVSGKWKETGNCRFIDFLNVYNNIKVDVSKKPYATVRKLEQTELCRGDILLTSASETPDDCAMSSVVADEIEKGIFIDDHLFGIRIKEEYKDTINPVFLNYVLRSSACRKKINRMVRGVTRFYITGDVFARLLVPIPPLEVQDEIVQILDNFAELTAELTAELSNRKKQYRYYKNALFDLKSTPMIALGDCCVVQAGGTPSKTKPEYWTDGNIKWLSSTVCKNTKDVDDITGYITELGLAKSSAKVMKPGTTLIALVGATIGKTAYLKFDAAINQNVAGIYPIDDSKLDPSYVYYACTMLYNQFINLSNGKLAMANMSFVRGLKIPVPQIETQRKIVSLLDKFEAINSSFEEGLPAEIEAREKQYAYYRDKLLTFEEAK